MSAPASEEMSKSARKRANQKARAAEAEAAPEPPAPAPAPKSKAAAKAKAAQPPAEPAAKAKGKAKAQPKAAEPAPAPKAEAKAKAKGKAKAEPAEPAPAPKAEAKPKAAKKAAAKPKAAAPEPEEPKPSADGGIPFELDDGKGGGWEVSSGLSTKAAKRKEKAEQKATEEKEYKAAGIIEARSNQHIPGLAPASVQAAQGKKGGPQLKGSDLVSQAVARVAVVTAAAAATADNKGPTTETVSDNNVTATIKVPEGKIGRVVGPKGANIIMIKEKTGVKTIDMSGEECTILGPADAVVLAEHAVRQLVEKGYMSLAFEDFEEDGVSLHPSVFPDIIGKGGDIIKAIKKEAKVEIDIPAVPKSGPGGKKYKVMLAGSKTSVTLGKEILNSIALYGHHELTHPGQVHKEMEVEEWRYRFLIGSKGSEMRHIQNNFSVKVSIPREHSECQNVVVVGLACDVDRAAKYIEKILFEADQPRGRGATEKAADDFGGDEPVEDWMKPYMYQRK